jgi:hypothetical protein
MAGPVTQGAETGTSPTPPPTAQPTRHAPCARPPRQGGGARRHSTLVCLAWERIPRLLGRLGVGARPQEHTDGDRAHWADLPRPPCAHRARGLGGARGALGFSHLLGDRSRADVAPRSPGPPRRGCPSVRAACAWAPACSPCRIARPTSPPRRRRPWTCSRGGASRSA